MLLVTHKDVGDKWTFTRQERDCKLDSLAVPVLRVFSLVGDSTNLLIQLMEETELCAHAEVGHCQETELLEHEFPRKLDLQSCRRHEVLQSQRGNLHNIANIQTVDPLVLVQVAKYVLHVCVADLKRHSTAQTGIGFLLTDLDHCVWGDVAVSLGQTVVLFLQWD